MTASIYFSYGMTKCGSTFAFELIRQLLETNSHDQKKLPDDLTAADSDINFLDTLNPTRAGRIAAHVAKTDTSVALKTHAAPNDRIRDMLVRGEALGHAVYRDPRDMALSLLDHGRRAREAGERAFSEIVTLDDAIAAIDRQLKTLSAWLRLPGIMPLYFEDVIFRSTTVIEALQRQTGLSGDPVAIEDAVRTTRFTQFNVGNRRRWRSEMSTQDSERIKTRFAPLIRRMIRRRGALPTDGSPVLGPRQTLERRNTSAEAAR